MRYTSVLLLALALSGFSLVRAQSPSPVGLQHSLEHGLLHGMDRVTLYLTLLHPLPAGARYQCRVTAAAPNLLPGESVTALAVVSGNHATCVLPMPLAWFPPITNPVASAMPAPELRFTITAYPAPDAPAAPLRRIALPAIAVALPQPDGIRAVDLPLAF